MANDVRAHYAGQGDAAAASDVAGTILAALARSGKTIDALEPADLSPVDEFHVRGRAATLELVAELGVDPGGRVLDIGSGLGGPARTIAVATGAHVTGIDLTPQYCEAATRLSELVGLADRTRFMVGDATDLPFDDAAFDAAVTLHVAMNIARKDAMHREAHRVVRPSGRFVVYDILRGSGEAVLFPVPWAREPSISHLASEDEMETLLEEAGWSIRGRRDSTAEGEAFFASVLERLATSGPPPLSLATFLGADFPQMAKNLHTNLAERRVRTVAFVCER